MILHSGHSEPVGMFWTWLVRDLKKRTISRLFLPRVGVLTVWLRLNVRITSSKSLESRECAVVAAIDIAEV